MKPTHNLNDHGLSYDEACPVCLLISPKLTEEEYAEVVKKIVSLAKINQEVIEKHKVKIEPLTFKDGEQPSMMSSLMWNKINQIIDYINTKETEE